jgi:cell division protein FtsL
MSQPTFVPKVSKDIHPEVQRHLNLLYQTISNHAQAFAELKSQITDLQSQVKTIKG